MADTDPTPAATKIKVYVPQDTGQITIHTYDADPHVFDVKSGAIAADSQAQAEFLLARVDGASLTK